MTGRSAAFSRLFGEANLLPHTIGGRVRDAFDAAFNVLKQAGVRDEYIYKSALTRRVLLGRHNLRTASMLSEFRVGDCKADIVILNGTTTVYEIKSERDSLKRLERQIANYRKVFASVYVVAGEKHVEAVTSAVPDDVGIMGLSPRQSIQTRREAKNSPERICPLATFEALRTQEIRQILTQLGMELPVVPNTKMRRELQRIFTTLDPQEIHGAMLHTLKRTRDLQPLTSLVDRLPQSLHAVALSVPLRRCDHERLVLAVNTPIANALHWH